MADIEKDESEEFEVKATVKDKNASVELRRTVADTYTFVRSVELTKTIASFTLDHYIDEAKRKIKDERVLRTASDPTKGIGRRPSQLQVLEKLEADFNKAYEKAKELAASAPEEAA